MWFSLTFYCWTYGGHSVSKGMFFLFPAVREERMFEDTEKVT